jgi:hypothetical protein
MILTPGSIRLLQKGALSDQLDVNAIDDNKTLFYANQFIWEEELIDIPRVQLDEYKPILEVVSLVWLGSKNGCPLIKLIVTDGTTTMEMRPSQRNPTTTKHIFGKAGHLFKGKLNVGKRFRLLEYTTDSTLCSTTNKIVPAIFFEKVLPEIQAKNKKSHNRVHGKNGNGNKGYSNPSSNTAGYFPTSHISVDKAITELEFDLAQLSMHRKRLGY